MRYRGKIGRTTRIDRYIGASILTACMWHKLNIMYNEKHGLRTGLGECRCACLVVSLCEQHRVVPLLPMPLPACPVLPLRCA